MHSTIFIFANFTFLWEVPFDVESTAAQDGAKRSPERKQRCWQEPGDGERSAPGNPACGKGAPRLCSPLPAPGAGTWLSLQQLLPQCQGSCPTCRWPGHGWVCATHGWKHHPSAQQPTEAVLLLWSSRHWAVSDTLWCQQKLCSCSWWCGLAQPCSLWWAQEAFCLGYESLPTSSALSFNRSQLL